MSETTAVVPVAKTVQAFLAKNRGALTAAMPKHVNPDRLMRVAVGAINRTPALQRCRVESLITAIVASSTLGLEVNGPLGEAYLVPFKDQVTFIPGYRGLMTLARRSGMVTLFYADTICANDEYSIERGLEPKLVHKPAREERGEPLYFYAVFHTKDTKDFEVMTVAEIDRIRRMSKAANSGPWVEHFEEMAKKTVIRRLAKRAPMSAEMAMAARLDEEAAMGQPQDFGDVIDTTGVAVPEAQAASATAPERDGEVIGQPKTAPAPKAETAAAPAPAPTEEAPAQDGDGLPMISVSEIKEAINHHKLTEAQVVLALIDGDDPWLTQGQGLGKLQNWQRRELVNSIIPKLAKGGQ